MSTLSDIVKGFIGKLAVETKNYTELNCRTDSNMIDALTGVLYHANITKTDMTQHIEKRPFKLVCWEKNIISKIVNEQQAKADMFIKNHINKIEFKEQEENSVLTVPDEVRNIRGFTAIPPYLRVFPSNLALQNIKKSKYEEKEDDNELLKIKNKRAIEDKIVNITLKENLQKSADDVNSNGKDKNKAAAESKYSWSRFHVGFVFDTINMT